MTTYSRQCKTDAEVELAMAEAPAESGRHLEDPFDALDSLIDTISAAITLRTDQTQALRLLACLEHQLPEIRTQLLELTNEMYYELERRAFPVPA